MDDDVFGHLRFDRSSRAWHGISALRFTDEETTLAIHSGGPPPTQNQKNTYTDLIVNFKNYRETIEREAYRYQRRYSRWMRMFILPVYFVLHRLTTGENLSGDFVSIAKQPSDIWRFLAVPAIEIPEDYEDTSTVAFLFECDWNPNDGFIIVIANRKVVFVGSQAER